MVFLPPVSLRTFCKSWRRTKQRWFWWLIAGRPSPGSLTIYAFHPIGNFQHKWEMVYLVLTAEWLTGKTYQHQPEILTGEAKEHYFHRELIIIITTWVFESQNISLLRGFPRNKSCCILLRTFFVLANCLSHPSLSYRILPGHPQKCSSVGLWKPHFFPSVLSSPCCISLSCGCRSHAYFSSLDTPFLQHWSRSPFYPWRQGLACYPPPPGIYL